MIHVKRHIVTFSYPIVITGNQPSIGIRSLSLHFFDDVLIGGIGTLGKYKYIAAFDHDKINIIHDLGQEGGIVFLPYNDIGLFISDFFESCCDPQIKRTIHSIIPSRYDILCSNDICDVYQPADAEYEPEIPIAPGYNTLAVYTSESEAAKLAESGSIDRLVMMILSTEKNGNINGLTIVENSGSTTSSVSIYMKGEDEIAFFASSNEGGMMSGKAGSVIEKIADALADTPEPLIFLGAMVFNPRKMAKTTHLIMGCKDENNTKTLFI